MDLDGPTICKSGRFGRIDAQTNETSVLITFERPETRFATRCSQGEVMKSCREMSEIVVTYCFSSPSCHSLFSGEC